MKMTFYCSKLICLKVYFSEAVVRYFLFSSKCILIEESLRKNTDAENHFFAVLVDFCTFFTREVFETSSFTACWSVSVSMSIRTRPLDRCGSACRLVSSSLPPRPPLLGSCRGQDCTGSFGTDCPRLLLGRSSRRQTETDAAGSSGTDRRAPPDRCGTGSAEDRRDTAVPVA